MGRKNCTSHNKKARHRHSWIDTARRTVDEIMESNIGYRAAKGAEFVISGVIAENKAKTQTSPTTTSSVSSSSSNSIIKPNPTTTSKETF